MILLSGVGRLSNTWWLWSAEKVAKTLNSTLHNGLTPREAERRLAEHGENILQPKARISQLKLFFSEFTDFMVLVLLGAVAISGALGEWVDAITILAIVILNALLGFIQEYRAERSLEALKELAAPEARVVRAGRQITVSATKVTPGDLLLLETGDRVPADLRLVKAIGLEIDESPLTGESIPVEKTDAPLREEAPGLGERRNMVYAGTTITRGRASGMVVATGMRTELGKIAGLLGASEGGPTPLQLRLDQLGKTLVILCVTVCLFVGLMGLWRGGNFREMFLFAVSLAVAAIPEGLPAVVTISLALGVQKMIRRQVLIRRLPAVETLGCATVICSDKTGTLTQNQMMVTKIFTGAQEITVTGSGFAPQGELLWEGRPLKLSEGFKSYPDPEGLKRLFLAAMLCNNSRLEEEAKIKRRRVLGDPTEGALLVLALKAGLGADHSLIRYGEVPFTSERKRMSVAVAHRESRDLYVKGASDYLLGLSDRIRWEGKDLPLQRIHRQLIERIAEEMAKDALRVLALAYRPLEANHRQTTEEDERNLIFLGLVGMIDPPRPEVRSALRICRRAGVRTVMITGDYPVTARAVGKEIGLLSPDGLVVTGKELDMMTETQLAEEIERIDIFARVNPHHKLMVIRAFKKRGAVVAMTGDGINDAPAVKEADIGASMGITGTDVTKEASDMVIIDDNFATIVAAVEEGRGIYNNIRKFIRYLLGCNTGEILTMFLVSVLGLPLPLLPIQILWTNLVTDGLPAIALGVEPTEKELMNQPPRSRAEGVFSRGLGWKIAIQGTAIGLMVTVIFILSLRAGINLAEARTIALSALVFAQLSYVFTCRSETRPFWRMKMTDNPLLAGAVIVCGLMHISIIHLPFLNNLFQTTPLNITGWSWVGLAAIASVLVSEALRVFARSVQRSRWRGIQSVP